MFLSTKKVSSDKNTIVVKFVEKMLLIVAFLLFARIDLKINNNKRRTYLIWFEKKEKEKVFVLPFLILLSYLSLLIIRFFFFSLSLSFKYAKQTNIISNSLHPLLLFHSHYFQNCKIVFASCVRGKSKKRPHILNNNTPNIIKNNLKKKKQKKNIEKQNREKDKQRQRESWKLMQSTSVKRKAYVGGGNRKRDICVAKANVKCASVGCRRVDVRIGRGERGQKAFKNSKSTTTKDFFFFFFFFFFLILCFVWRRSLDWVDF